MLSAWIIIGVLLMASAFISHFYVREEKAPIGLLIKELTVALAWPFVYFANLAKACILTGEALGKAITRPWAKAYQKYTKKRK